MANIQQLAECLLKTNTGTTQQIKKAQATLQSLSKNQNINFIQLLLSIPQMNNVSPKLAQLAVTYTLPYSRNLVNWKIQASINIAAQGMLTFISKTNIQFNYKNRVAIALTYLVQKDKNNVISNAFIPNTINLLETAINMPISEVNIQYFALISQILCSKLSPNGGNNVQEYFSKSFICLCYFVKEIVKYSFEIQSSVDILQRVFVLVVKMMRTLKFYMKKFMYFSQNLMQVLYKQQFIQMISIMLSVHLPNNKLNSNLFYVRPQIQQPNNIQNKQQKLIQLFHTAKSLLITIYTQTLRVIFMSKNPKLQKQSKIIQQTPFLIVSFVNSINIFLQFSPYYKISSLAIIKIFQQVYNLLIVCLRSCKFYAPLLQIKHTLIFECLMKNLALSSQDIKNYKDDPQQFVQSLIQIIQINQKAFIQTPNNNNIQVNQQQLTNLKTHAANLIKTYVKYIDGSLVQIMEYTLNVLQDKINLQSSKNLMFFLLCILRDQIKGRYQDVDRIKKIVIAVLKSFQVNYNQNTIIQNFNPQYSQIQFSLTLLLLSKYILIFHTPVCDTQLNKNAFACIKKMLQNDKIGNVLKILSSQVLLGILKSEEGEQYSRRVIELLNSLLSVKQLNQKYLQCISYVLQQNETLFANNYLPLIETVQKISALLQYQIKKQTNQKLQQNGTQSVHKLWHIFEQIVESRDLVILMAQSVKRVLQPLLNLINGQSNKLLQQKLIKATGVVDQFQLQIFSILPKIFYIGHNKYGFSSCFALLQSTIFYGSHIISSNLIILKNIVLFCVESINAKTVNQKDRNQFDILEGIFIIQSLILSVGQTFDDEIWMTITKCLTKKVLQNNTIYDFVKGTLISTLSLILSANIKNFNASDSDQLIKLILKEVQSLIQNWPRKLFLISMANLIQNTNYPFIASRFNQIIDCIITLLTISSIKLGIKEQQMFDDPEVKQFQKLVLSLQNVYLQIDQFQLFRNTILTIKDTNRNMIENAYSELPETKQQYFKEVLNLKTVNNQSRYIYKFKQTTSNKM